MDRVDDFLLIRKADKVFAEEERNVLILFEFYKLELSLVIPKICLLVRKAKGKGKAKLIEKTKAVGKRLYLL